MLQSCLVNMTGTSWAGFQFCPQTLYGIYQTCLPTMIFHVCENAAHMRSSLPGQMPLSFINWLTFDTVICQCPSQAFLVQPRTKHNLLSVEWAAEYRAPPFVCHSFKPYLVLKYNTTMEKSTKQKRTSKWRVTKQTSTKPLPKSRNRMLPTSASSFLVYSWHFKIRLFFAIYQGL
jgi:hypothetical protein